MTSFGVPIFDWVLLVVVLGFGIEAYITTRPSRKSDRPASAKPAEDQDSLGKPEHPAPVDDPDRRS